MRSRAVLVCVALAGCQSAPAATTEFFGPTIEPPHGLAKLKPGMSVADAKKLLPALRDDPRAIRDQLVLDSGVSDVKLEVRAESGTVASIVAIVAGSSTRDLLTRAWGEPQITRDSLGQPEVTWSSESWTRMKVEPYSAAASASASSGRYARRRATATAALSRASGW